MAKKKEKSVEKNYRFLLGLDPSLNGTGYCVLDCRYKEPRIANVGVVKGRNDSWGDTPHQVKLALIQAKVKELRAMYDPIYPIVFMERGFTKYNNDTQSTFRARGALEAELVGLEIVEFPPNTVKRIATGNGAASKEEVAKSMAKIFNVPLDIFPTEDASDATAVAYVGYLEYFKKGVI